MDGIKKLDYAIFTKGKYMVTEQTCKDIAAKMNDFIASENGWSVFRTRDGGRILNL